MKYGKLENDIIAFCESDKQYSSIEDVIKDVENKLGDKYNILFTNTGIQYEFDDTMISFIIDYKLDVDLFINNDFKITNYSIVDEFQD